MLVGRLLDMVVLKGRNEKNKDEQKRTDKAYKAFRLVLLFLSLLGFFFFFLLVLDAQCSRAAKSAAVF